MEGRPSTNSHAQSTGGMTEGGGTSNLTKRGREGKKAQGVRFLQGENVDRLWRFFDSISLTGLCSQTSNSNEEDFASSGGLREGGGGRKTPLVIQSGGRQSAQNGWVGLRAGCATTCRGSGRKRDVNRENLPRRSLRGRKRKTEVEPGPRGLGEGKGPPGPAPHGGIGKRRFER